VTTSTNHTDHTASKAAWVEEQVVATLFKNGLGAIVGNLINIALASYLLIKVFPLQPLLSWFLFGQFLNLARVILLKSYSKNPKLLPSSTWRRLHHLCTTLSGLHFGLLPLLFFHPDLPMYQALIILLVGGSGAAAVSTHGIDLTCYRLFLFPSVFPLIVRLFYEGTEIYQATAIMLILLVVVMHRAARQTETAMVSNLEMTFSLRYRATHDTLVSLLNRDEFENVFKEKQTQHRNNTLNTLMFIDLDNFKKLNDTLGHHAGDDALKKVGEIIRTSIRKSDIAGRFGGDEFMVCLHTDDINDAIGIGDKILSAIREFSSQLESPECELSASIGIAYTSNTNISYNSLLKLADEACYQAKNDGKGKVRIQEAA
jgi:diguanylate cyclase (GGDEF)-like protein